MNKFLLILLVNIPLYTFSQPKIVWEKSFGGIGPEDLTDIQKTPDGGFVFVGSARSNSGDVNGVFNSTNYENNNPVNIRINNSDLWIVKLDINRNIEWSQVLGGNLNDYGRKVLVVDDGIVVAGIINSTDGDLPKPVNSGKIVLMKYSFSGQRLWRTFTTNSASQDLGNVIKTSDDGFLVLGHVQTQNHSDIYVIKFNFFGNILWSKTYGGLADDYGLDVLQEENRYLILAKTYSSNSGDVPINPYFGCSWLFSIDTFGFNLSSKTILIGDLNRIIKAGSNYFLGGERIRIVKLNLDFTQVWERVLENKFSSINNYDDDHIIISGDVYNDSGIIFGKKNPGISDVWIVKMKKSDGSVSWQKCIGGSGIEGALSYGQSFLDTYNLSFRSYASLIIEADKSIIIGTYSRSMDGDRNIIKDQKSFLVGDSWIFKISNEFRDKMVIDSLGLNSVCIGSQQKLFFNLNNFELVNNSLIVQLSDSKGNFDSAIDINISVVSNPIIFNTPNNSGINGSYGYKVRLKSNTGEIISNESNDFAINTIPSSKIFSDKTIEQESSTSLNVKFNGGPPYLYKLNNNIFTSRNTDSLILEELNPIISTSYEIKELSNSCGLASNNFPATINVRYCTPRFLGNSYSTFCMKNFSILNDDNESLYQVSSTICLPFFNEVLNQQLNLTANQNYSLKAIAATTNNITNSSFNVAVWLDVNGDSVFNQNERISTGAFIGINSSNNTLNSSFLVPANSITGKTRLRVVTYLGTSPCLGGYWVRDFSVNISPEPQNIIIPSTSIGEIKCLQDTASFHFNVQGILPDNFLAKVIISDEVGNFANSKVLEIIESGNPIKVIFPDNLDIGSGYRIKIKSANGGILSNVSHPFKIHTVPKAILIGSNEIIPPNGDFQFRVKFEGGESGTYSYNSNFGLTNYSDNVLITKYPNESIVYRINSISNICGIGLPSNSLIVEVNSNACSPRGNGYYGAIKSFVLKDTLNQIISNNSSTNFTNGYQMFDSTVYLKKGSKYLFDVLSGYGMHPGLGRYGPGYQLFTIWLDSNKDHIFSNEEILYSNYPNSTFYLFLNGYIRVPKIMESGRTRIRIRAWNPSNVLVNPACDKIQTNITTDVLNISKIEDFWVYISSCDEKISISNSLSSEIKTFKAVNKIEMYNSVLNQSRINLKVNGSINLNNGFSVERGSVFLAEANGCEND